MTEQFQRHEHERECDLTFMCLLYKIATELEYVNTSTKQSLTSHHCSTLCMYVRIGDYFLCTHSGRFHYCPPSGCEFVEPTDDLDCRYCTLTGRVLEEHILETDNEFITKSRHFITSKTVLEKSREGKSSEQKSAVYKKIKLLVQTYQTNDDVDDNTPKTATSTTTTTRAKSDTVEEALVDAKETETEERMLQKKRKRHELKRKKHVKMNSSMYPDTFNLLKLLMRDRSTANNHAPIPKEIVMFVSKMASVLLQVALTSSTTDNDASLRTTVKANNSKSFKNALYVYYTVYEVCMNREKCTNYILFEKRTFSFFALNGATWCQKMHSQCDYMCVGKWMQTHLLQVQEAKRHCMQNEVFTNAEIRTFEKYIHPQYINVMRQVQLQSASATHTDKDT